MFTMVIYDKPNMVELDLVLNGPVKTRGKDRFHHYRLTNCKRTPILYSIRVMEVGGIQ